MEPYYHNPELKSLMTDVSIVTPLIKKILQTMKSEEKVSCKIKPEYYKENDKQIIEKFRVNTEEDLFIDIEMKQLIRVEDVYKDGGSTLHKTLQKGHGTASPYSDFQIISKKIMLVMRNNSQGENRGRCRDGLRAPQV